MLPAPGIPGEFEQRERVRRESKIFLTFLSSLEGPGASFRRRINFHPLAEQSRDETNEAKEGSKFLVRRMVLILKDWALSIDELFILLIELGVNDLCRNLKI